MLDSVSERVKKWMAYFVNLSGAFVSCFWKEQTQNGFTVCHAGTKVYYVT